MERISRRIVIEAALRSVFDLVADPRRFPEWIKGVVEITDVALLPIGKIGEGVTYAWNYRMLGLPLTGTGRCTHYSVSDRECSATFVTAGSVQSTWLFTVHPDSRGVLVEFSIEYDVPATVLGRFTAVAARRVNDQLAQQSLETLKLLMENGLHEGH